jgi:hypothetical protein
MSCNASVAQHIVDDEQRQSPHVNAGSIAPQPPCALWVPAARGHLLRWRSSTMYTDIACVAPPCICPRGARNAVPPITRTGS